MKKGKKEVYYEQKFRSWVYLLDCFLFPKISVPNIALPDMIWVQSGKLYCFEMKIGWGNSKNTVPITGLYCRQLSVLRELKDKGLATCGVLTNYIMNEHKENEPVEGELNKEVLQEHVNILIKQSEDFFEDEYKKVFKT